VLGASVDLLQKTFLSIDLCPIIAQKRANVTDDGGFSRFFEDKKSRVVLRTDHAAEKRIEKGKQ